MPSNPRSGQWMGGKGSKLLQSSLRSCCSTPMNKHGEPAVTAHFGWSHTCDAALAGVGPTPSPSPSILKDVSRRKRDVLCVVCLSI